MNAISTIESRALASSATLFTGSPTFLTIIDSNAIPLDADANLQIHYPFNGNLFDYNVITQNASGQYFINGVSDATTSGNLLISSNKAITGFNYSLSISGGCLNTNVPVNR